MLNCYEEFTGGKLLLINKLCLVQVIWLDYGRTLSVPCVSDSGILKVVCFDMAHDNNASQD